jgi:hypothetical protein
MTRMDLPTATMAFLPASARDSPVAGAEEGVGTPAMTAASPSTWARYRLPCPVDPLHLFFPALDLIPGANLAQEHKCAGVGKRVMSVPISARMMPAAAACGRRG